MKTKNLSKDQQNPLVQNAGNKKSSKRILPELKIPKNSSEQSPAGSPEVSLPMTPPITPLTPVSEQRVSGNPDPPRMLDLFSGTGSVGKVFREAGYLVTSLDSDPKFNADIQLDILNWDYKSAFTPGYFEIIFCCPPCTEFSRAKTTKERDFPKGDILVEKALEIIKYLKPSKWFLENPRGGYLKDRPYMKNIPYVDVDYCQFSDWGYKKITRIWG